MGLKGGADPIGYFAPRGEPPPLVSAEPGGKPTNPLGFFGVTLPSFETARVDTRFRDVLSDGG